MVKPDDVVSFKIWTFCFLFAFLSPHESEAIRVKTDGTGLGEAEATKPRNGYYRRSEYDQDWRSQSGYEGTSMGIGGSRYRGGGGGYGYGYGQKSGGFDFQGDGGGSSYHHGSDGYSGGSFGSYDQNPGYGGGRYPPSGGNYPPSGGKYPPSGGKYPPSGGKYPPSGGRYPPSGGRYPPSGGRHPPSGGRHPPSGERYPPSGERYPPSGGRQPPSDSYFPSGVYPPSGTHQPGGGGDSYGSGKGYQGGYQKGYNRPRLPTRRGKWPKTRTVLIEVPIVHVVPVPVPVPSRPARKPRPSYKGAPYPDYSQSSGRDEYTGSGNPGFEITLSIDRTNTYRGGHKGGSSYSGRW